MLLGNFQPQDDVPKVVEQQEHPENGKDLLDAGLLIYQGSL